MEARFLSSALLHQEVAMKVIALLISILALVFSFEAYQKAKSLEPLMPLAEAVTEARTVTKGAKDKVAGARESAGQTLIDLGRQLKGKE